jgi:hypothetical protein
MTVTTARVVLLVGVLSTIGCDQVTKHVATSVLAGGPERSYLADIIRIGYVENTGGFLSLGAQLPPALRTMFFTGVTGAVLVAAAILAILRRWNRARCWVWRSSWPAAHPTGSIVSCEAASSTFSTLASVRCELASSMSRMWRFCSARLF